MPSPSSRRRHLAIAVSALIHSALLTLLFRAPVGVPMGSGSGLADVSFFSGVALAAPSSPAPPKPSGGAPAAPEAKVAPEPPPPTDLDPQYVDNAPPLDLAARDPLNDPVAASVAAAASAAAGDPCRLTAWLQEALQADPQVQAALALVPRPDRSVANAVMLWNGDWIEGRPEAALGVAAVRAAVLSGVRAAPAACQNAAALGPELLTLTNGTDTTVIAIGSGEWRWTDLHPPAGREAPRTAATR